MGKKKRNIENNLGIHEGSVSFISIFLSLMSQDSVIREQDKLRPPGLGKTSWRATQTSSPLSSDSI